MKIGERVTYCSLEGVSLCGSMIYSLRVPSGFGERAEFDVNTSHVFPQGVLAAITLVGCGAGDRGVRAKARCELRIPLCSVAVLLYLGWGQVPSCWSRSPESRV